MLVIVTRYMVTLKGETEIGVTVYSATLNCRLVYVSAELFMELQFYVLLSTPKITAILLKNNNNNCISSVR